jgi:hypothetical protein
VIILRFGKSGRLARVCESAARLIYPESLFFNATRGRTFQGDRSGSEWPTVEALLRSQPNQQVLVLDASVDHSSTEAMIAHEDFKRKTLTALNRAAVLDRVVGFSSGITLVDATRIRATATHMLEYRRQKLAQEELFVSLPCAWYLPQLFTLVGPITYANQSAAWAQILKARLDRVSDAVLNEPHVRKAWTSELHVLRTLLDFLSAVRPANRTGPLVSGEFTLAQIASDPALPVPPLAFAQGHVVGWMSGDYLPPMPLHNSQTIIEELLRSLNP